MIQDVTLANRTAGPPPQRKPGSLRRTSSMQTFWPEGETAPWMIAGRARDIYTPIGSGQAQVLDTADIDARMSTERRIVALGGSNHRETLAGFVGLSPGGQLRKAMAAQIPEEAEQNSLLHRLLDDMAGATFMSMSGWYDWQEAGHVKVGFQQPVVGVCISFSPGSEALTPEGFNNEAIADHPFSPPPFSGVDPIEWHEFAATPGPNAWRLRRTDMHRSDGQLVVDAWFQDSSVLPGRTDMRRIFHEYSIRATFDDDSMLRLRSVDVTPRVLPFRTCLAAPDTARALVGRSALEFRGLVVELLAGTSGCTHLNDMLRSLQDVAAIAARLRVADSVGAVSLPSIAG